MQSTTVLKPLAFVPKSFLTFKSTFVIKYFENFITLSLILEKVPVNLNQ